MPELAEPVSHYTDAVRAGELLFVSGCIAVDGDGRLVGGDDVVAQTRQVFANLEAILSAAGASFADVVKVTVFLTDIDDRPAVNDDPARGVRRHAAGEHARRGLEAGARRRARRDRGRRAAPVTDPYNALITELEPAAPRPGPLHGKRLVVKDLIDIAGHPHDVRLAHLRRPRADARRPPRSSGSSPPARSSPAKANLHEFAWGVTSQNPWYGTVQNPRLPGRTTGGSSGGNAAALAAGTVRPRARHRHGLLDPAARVLLRRRRAEAELGPHPGRRCVPLCPTFDTVGPMARTVADVALMWSVLAGKRRCRSRGSPGCASGC